MAKIERLTPEQAAQVPIWRNRYLRAGLSTEPADRERAEAAFAAAYRRIGREPVPVVWADSPLTASLLLHGLRHAADDASLRDSLWDSLRDSLWDSLWDSLGGSLWDSLRASLWDSLWDSLGDSLRASHAKAVYTHWWGAVDLYWVAFYRFCEECLGVRYDPGAAEGLRIMDDIGYSCGWWYPLNGLIVACERPEAVSVEPVPGASDGRVRLHSADGPAVRFRDGWSTYCWHGVRVPQKLIESPDLITRADLLRETNAEARRAYMERLGSDRFAELLDLREIDRDGDAALYRTTEPDPVAAEYIQFVGVTCPSTGRRYMLCVPPGISRARAAVAWTFGQTADEYRPLVET
jgi:hypothetical protein